MGILNLKKERLMKFIEDSDPIDDMGIGTKNILKKVFPNSNISSKKEDGRTIWLIKGDVLSSKGDIKWEEFNELSKDIKYIVEGNFWIDGNNLNSLKGCPKEVHGSFSCTGNQLKSLEGMPREIGGNVWIDGNKLTSLEGCPREVHGSFSCTGNPLETLKGLPDIIKGNVWIV